MFFPMKTWNFRHRQTLLAKGQKGHQSHVRGSEHNSHSQGLSVTSVSEQSIFFNGDTMGNVTQRIWYMELCPFCREKNIKSCSHGWPWHPWLSIETVGDPLNFLLSQNAGYSQQCKWLHQKNEAPNNGVEWDYQFWDSSKLTSLRSKFVSLTPTPKARTLPRTPKSSSPLVSKFCNCFRSSS